jgi:ADP-heptose:LPS heptosyltransferase
MKILVVSLLRIGDVLMALPMLHGLRQTHPGADIHLLVNSEISSLVPLVDFVRWHYFDRSNLQLGLGDYDHSLFDSFHKLGATVDNLNRESFDLLINVTQNRLSGWLCSAIHARDKIGLRIDRNGVGRYGSSWFSHLNDCAGEENLEPFHYSDMFSYGAGVRPINELTLRETEDGLRESENLIPKGNGPLVLVQTLTSDAKKNWSEKYWIETLCSFKLLQPHSRILILGAPFERDVLLQLSAECERRKLNSRLALCSISGAFSLLKRANLLVTGDTSIKHLAGLAGCPTLELSLGSSDFRRTGVYRAGNVIIQSLEPCAPCPQRGPCVHSSHRCGDRLTPVLVASVANQIIGGSEGSIRLLAHEYREDVRIYKTGFVGTGYWVATPQCSHSQEWMVRKFLEKSTWKLMLEREHQKKIGEFGSEGRRLLLSMAKDPSSFDKEQLNLILSKIEKDALSFETWSRCIFEKAQILSRCGDKNHAFSDLIEELSKKAEMDGGAGLLLSYLRSRNGFQEEELVNLSVLRRICSLVEDLKVRSDIRLRIIRSMQTEQGAMI